MRVDDIKIALECSDDAHQSVVQALEDGRMVVFKGSILFVEQEDGTLEQFRLVSYLALGGGAWEALSSVTLGSRDDLDITLPLGAILRDSAFFLIDVFSFGSYAHR